MTAPNSTRPWAPGDPDAEYEALLKDQAEKEGLSVAASKAGKRDSYGGLFTAAQSRAASLGVTLQALYDHDRALIEQSDYPSDACIRPFEVELYLADALEPQRRNHVQACPACTALVEGAVPSTSRQAEWLDELRHIAAGGPVLTRTRIDDGRDAWLTDVIATGLPIGGLAVLFGVIAGSWLVLVPGIAMTIGASAPFLHAHRDQRFSAATFGSVWSSSRGAILTATAAVFVLLIGIGLWQQNEVAIVIEEKDREIIQSYLTSVATTAVGEWRSTGEHPMKHETAEAFTVSTNLRSSDRAVYEVAAPGDSQRFVAELKGDTGTLYWRAAGSGTWNTTSSDTVAKIITGELREVRPDRITIEDREGRSYSLAAAANLDFNVELGEAVAVTNPDMTQLISIAMLNTDG